MGNFSDQIDRFVINTEEKLLEVTRRAIQETVEDAQLSVSKGGKMPVDTGFLRWSGSASLNSIPLGEGRGRKRKKGDPTIGVLPEYASYKNGESLLPVLLRMKLGDVFYFGWTAKYARKQEARKGFLETAVRNFKSHVQRAVAEFRK